VGPLAKADTADLLFFNWSYHFVNYLATFLAKPDFLAGGSVHNLMKLQKNLTATIAFCYFFFIHIATSYYATIPL